MFFSIKTIALVASLASLATVTVASPVEYVSHNHTIAARGVNLCDKTNYGATGVPWKTDSVPGAWCGSQKPSNSGKWKDLPTWDGGDTIKCNSWSYLLNSWFSGKLAVCSGGNSKSSVPKSCNPPHWIGGRVVTITTGGSKTSAKSTTTSKALTTSTAAATTTASSSKSTATSIPTDASGNPVTVSSSSSTSTDSSSSTTSTSIVPTDAPTSTSISSGAVVTATAIPDPLSNPVCESKFQVMYTNYTLVAPNGVWSGLTVGAALQDASYMTYTLAATVGDCLKACDQIEGCVFVNTYYDVNETEEDLPKHTPGVLTCAMFSKCVGTENNNNFGGQDDPNTIVQSNGYCKSGACS